MTTLVIGATGFLGRHLLPALAERNGDVRALVRKPADAAAMLELGATEVVTGDVLDPVSLAAACAGRELVFNLAGVVSHKQSDRELLERVNVEGVANVIAALEPDARLVHVSSVAAVGPSPGPEPVDEEYPFPAYAERFPYATTKRAGELLVDAAVEASVDAVIANPSVLLGPGDVHGVSTWHVERYLSGWLRFSAPGGVGNVDARDVAAGLVTLAERGRTGERYILTNREGNLSHSEFFERLAKATGVRRRQVEFPAKVALLVSRVPFSPVGRGEVEAALNWWYHDPSKAERELGFTTRPLDETLVDTAAQYLGRR